VLRQSRAGRRTLRAKLRGLARVAQRRDGRVVECGRLEICCTVLRTGGSNPSLSANKITTARGFVGGYTEYGLPSPSVYGGPPRIADW